MNVLLKNGGGGGGEEGKKKRKEKKYELCLTLAPGLKKKIEDNKTYLVSKLLL